MKIHPAADHPNHTQRLTTDANPHHQDEKQPTAEESAKVVEWIAGKLKEGELARLAKREKVSFHKLTREEYANTIRDLRLINAAMAQTPVTDYKAMVCIFLNGGNDANNLFIPLIQTEYDEYAAIRTPSLAIPRDRAHLHYEIGFMMTQAFQPWYTWRKFGSPNEHGVWNGMNLMGIDLGPVRTPLRNLSLSQVDELAARLSEYDIFARPIQLRA